MARLMVGVPPISLSVKGADPLEHDPRMLFPEIENHFRGPCVGRHRTTGQKVRIPLPGQIHFFEGGIDGTLRQAVGGAGRERRGSFPMEGRLPRLLKLEALRPLAFPRDGLRAADRRLIPIQNMNDSSCRVFGIIPVFTWYKCILYERFLVM